MQEDVKIDEINNVSYYGKRRKNYSDLDWTQVCKCVDDLRSKVEPLRSAASSGIHIPSSTLRGVTQELRLRYGDVVFMDAYNRYTFEYFKQNASDIIKSADELKYELAARGEYVEE